MTTRKPVEGQKAGSKQKQPFRAKVTATTVMKAAILYGLTVGEARLFGTAPTEVDVLSRIYLDGTPIMDVNGTKLLDAEVEWRNGTIDQTVIEGMPSVSLPQDISAEVKYGVPLSRTMVTRDVTAYDIMLNIPQLYRGDAEGNSYAGTVAIKVEADNGDGIFVDFGTHTFEEKVINGFNPVITINVPKADSHTIRVTKLTPDATDEFSANAVAVYTITEIIEVRMAYPCTALLFVKYDAEQFSNIPKLEVRFFGVSDLLIPANYYPDDNRTYATRGAGTTNGVWDGTWKKGYSDNPIWHWLALATNKQWAIGNRIDISMIDKWELYRLAKYCDQLVPDGKGGQEPRFTCNNLYLNTAEDAYKVFKDLSSLIRGATIYDGQFLRPRIDTPRDAVHIFSQANVKDLRYSTVEDGAAHNVVHVQYYDKENRFATKVVTRRDKDDIRDRGSYFPLELAAFGVSSEGQAQRAAEYILASELTETEMIAFTTGLEGITPLVGDVFLFADNYTAGKAISGRIKAINGTQVTLDRLIDSDSVNGSFIVNTTNNAVATRKIVAINGAVITLDSALDSYSHPFLVWAIISETLGIPEFYIIESKYNAEDSTWSISGLQYSRKKYNKIDLASRIESPPFTSIVPNGISAPALLTLSYTSRIAQDMNVYSITAAWSDVTGASAYSLDMRKDGDTWVNLGRIYALTFDVDNVYEGIYEFRVRAVDVLGNYSPYTLSQPLQMRGKVLPPPVLDNYVVTGVLFGFKHSWVFPAHTEDSRGVRLRFSATDPSGSIQPLVTEIDKAYPATTHEDIGVPSGTTRWFSAAIVDKYGIVGQYTSWISAATSDDPDEILELIKGHVGIEAIDAELAKEITDASDSAKEAKQLAQQTRQETEQAVVELTSDINAEKEARIADVSALNNGLTKVSTDVDGVSSDLTTYKQATDNKLASVQQSVNVAVNDASVAVQKADALDGRVQGAETNAASALTKAQLAIDNNSATASRVDALDAAIDGKADSSYVEQIKITADNANNQASTNATQIAGLRSDVNGNTSQINSINQTKANKDEVASIAQTALQSIWQADAQAKVEALQLGGRNYLLDSKSLGIGTKKISTAFSFKENSSKTIALSFTLKVINPIQASNQNRIGFEVAVESTTGTVWFGVWANNASSLPVGTHRITQYVNLKSMMQEVPEIYYYNQTGSAVGTDFEVSNIKMEIGNKATDWSPAPEDMEATVANFKSEVSQTYQTKSDAISTTANLVTELQSYTQNTVNDLKVGGVNLITGTQIFDTSGNLKPNYNGFGNHWDGDKLQGKFEIMLANSDWHGFAFTGFYQNRLEQDCILSFWASVQDNGTISVGAFTNVPVINLGVISGAEWKRYSFKLPKGTQVFNGEGAGGTGYGNGVVEFYGFRQGTVVAYAGIQLQVGNKATDWTPSPLDTKVGGRNLLRNSEFKNGMDYWSIYDSLYLIQDVVVENSATKYIYLHGGSGGLYMKPENIPYVAKEGDMMTLSFYARGNAKMRVGFDDIAQDVQITRNGDAWTRYSVTLRRNRSDNVIMYVRDMDGSGTYVDLAKPKLELGTVASDWSPAPEDGVRALSDFQATVVNTYSTKTDTQTAVANGISQYSASIGQIATYKIGSCGLGQGWAGVRNSLNEYMYYTPRSYMVTLFKNGAVLNNWGYDVNGTDWGAQAVADRINEADNDTWIVITTNDEPRDGRNANMRDALISIGGTGAAFNNMQYRGAYMLIGRKGLLEGGGLEFINNGAQLEYSLQFVNGTPNGISGQRGNLLQGQANANAINQTNVNVSNLNGQLQSVASQTSTLTSSVNNMQASGDIYNTLVDIDLTDARFNQYTWYPVAIPIPARRNKLRVYALLDGRSHPSWATHGGGFTLDVAWEVSASLWGVVSPNRIVTSFTNAWTSNGISPAIRLDQLGASSREIIWLRGGGKYYASVPNSIILPDANGNQVDPIDGSTVYASAYTDQYIPKDINNRTNTNTVTLQQQAEVIDGIQAKWTVKINNNGYAAGFGLISTPNNGAIVSAFMVDADAFVVGKAGTNIKPIVSVSGGQTVEGIYYPESGTYLNTAWISKASIGTAHIGDSAITSAKIQNGAITNAKIENGAITNAKIGVAEIDTLRIRGRAVTVPYYYTDTNPVSIDSRFGDFPVSSNGSLIVPVVSAFSAYGFTPYAEVFIVCDVGILMSGLYNSANGEAVSVRLIQGYYDTASGNTPNAKRIDRANTITYYDDPSSPNVGTRWEVTNKSCGAFSRKMTADAYGNIALSLWVSSEGSVRNSTRLIVKPETEITWYVQELKR